MKEENFIFSETQRLSPIILGLMGLLLIVVLWSEFQAPPYQPILSVVMVPMSIIYFMTKLETHIDHRAIQIRLFPWYRKTILFSEIHSLSMIDCGSNVGLIQFPGIQIGTKYGTLYSMRGRNGLLVELINGRTLCIGTQKPEKLQTIINKISVK